MNVPVSKKFGGQDRANNARTSLSVIFSDPEHPLYFEKDIDLAKRFDISRLTIYNIRSQMGVPPRTERILKKLKGINTKKYTQKELADLLNIKYQNLYKIIRESNIKVKPDTPPIESMIKFQKEKNTKIVKAKKAVTKSPKK
jgi:DNA-binding XRE family transcriptional regulator